MRWTSPVIGIDHDERPIDGPKVVHWGRRAEAGWNHNIAKLIQQQFNEFCVSLSVPLRVLTEANGETMEV